MTDIEDRLRDALHTAAGAITAEPREFTLEPGDPAHDEELARPRLTHRWTWLLAAAAAVLLATGAVALFGGLGRHTTPAAPTSQRCTVPLPHSLSKVLARHVVDSTGSTHHAQLIALGVDAAGYTIAGDAGHEPEQLVAIRPDGSARQLATPSDTVRKQGFLAVGPAAVDGRWVIFTREQPGGADQPPSAVFAANTESGAVRRLSPLSLERSTYRLGSPVVAGGDVYFAATRTPQGTGVGSGFVYAYDLASGRLAIVDRGDVGKVTGAGGGVSWRHGSRTVVHRSGTVPPGYAPGGRSLVVDGASQAWLQTVRGSGTQLRMRVGSGHSVVVVPRPGQGAQVDALGGAYLAYSNNDRTLLFDTRTGAQVSLGGAVLAVDAGGGTFALSQVSGAGFRTSIVPVADLPELRC